MNRPFPFPVLLLAVACVLPAAATADERLPLFDAHSHYKSADADALSPAQVVAALDREGIERMVIVGEPAGRALALHALAPGRFVPFLGLYDSYRDKAGWMFDRELVPRLRAELARGPYAGIGELHMFAPERKSPVFREIVALAAEHELPLLVHGDAEVVDQVFAWAPGLTVLWAHLGTDPRPEAIRAMLARHPQRLYVDTSVRDERFTDGDTLRPEWRALFIDHADRLLAGIDTFSTQRWQGLDRVTARLRGWLAQLPPEVAARIAHGNARALFSRAD